MTKIPAHTGWLWLKEGVGLFRKQPAALTTLLFANILIMAVLGLVPIVGMLLAVLIPSLTIGYMQACLMIDNRERVTPAVLMTGFRQPALVRLCKVGLIYLAVSIVLTLLLHLAVDPAALPQMAPDAGPKAVPRVPMSIGSSLAMLVLFTVNACVLISLSFAAPLTYWQHMGPGKAAFYSFFAVLKNARVFIVLLMSWFGILFGIWIVLLLILGNGRAGLVAMIWTAFLFMLLLQCALYVGYRHIFGKPVVDGAKPVDLSK